ncbi:MAG: carbon-nitrogen hydrolase family protein [Paludibacteraceae bacterium]|nr:carbon-nitrogen hydrolase family protein [Paludibacteraceae bacterium]
MKHPEWKEITREDVLKAIELMKSSSNHNKSKTTFLEFDGFEYDAKSLRGLAYKVHFGREISVEEYHGGDETANFFTELGFTINKYTAQGKRIQVSKTEIKKEEKKEVVKTKEVETDSKTETIGSEKLIVGMYLQSDCQKDCNDEHFKEVVLPDGIKCNVDLLVFPETSYTLISKEIKNYDSCSEEIEKIYELCLNFSKQIQKAVVMSFEDSKKRIISVYANAFSEEGETRTHLYIKHTMTPNSALELKDYTKKYKDLFKPIILKGYRIGLTICYDCNFPIISRMYGLQNVDLIINTTGHDVIDAKWTLYNKVRAIENNCSTLVTMNICDIDKNSRTYGFNSKGGKIPTMCINTDEDFEFPYWPDGIYRYEINKNDTSIEEDNINKERNGNAVSHLSIPVGDTSSLLEKFQKISENIYVLNDQAHDANVVALVVNEYDILKPEKVLSLMYDKKLERYINKKYLIISRIPNLTEKQMKFEISPVLKVRAMENFCAVVLESNNFNKCYQCGSTHNSQMVPAVNGKFNIDFGRMSGPESTWKNKNQGFMKKSWRENYEYLIQEALNTK